MDTREGIGLPKPPEPGSKEPTAADLNRQRVRNLLGLVTPVANLGMLPYAPPEERWVGVGAGVIFCGLAVWGWATGTAWAWQFGLGAHSALVLLGLLNPLWPIGPARVWVLFGMGLGWFMQWPIFGGIYYLVVTPTAWLVRLFKGDPLEFDNPDGSYWLDHVPPDKERYERQF
jgi:hypothetical protein